MVQCAACGASNPAGKRFCGDCGTRLEPGCPSCGSPVEAGKRFCGDCGAPLAPDGAASDSTAASGLGQRPMQAGPRGPERRQVSVLFCDLVGYTPLAEGRDPEAVRELLSGYFDLARSIVARYGGVVEKFIGDAVMALWGAPLANEDDAERAVRAGLELVSAVPAYGSANEVDLQARVGIATGSAATTETAEEGLVIGDRVNTAARIQAVARPGSCYVDEASRRLAGNAVAFEDAGSHELKGKSEPEQLYCALRVISGVGGRQRAEGIEAPLVGRDAELRTLKDLFHATAERRSPRLVVVSGPAGVGKSRLGWEFEKYADGLVSAVLWHRGRCLSYGEGVTFWALAEIVRQRLGIAEEDPSEVAAGKLAEGLIRLVPEPERDYVGARLARLLGVELVAERNQSLPREELFAGWRLFFERLAGVAPVVLLVEDAQHADADLLAFLDHLVDWVRELPIFVVVFARPELTERRSGFGLGRNRSVLSLDPLDQASMDQLIEALVPGMGPEACQVITSRAQGVPLFAIETVRSLIDSGVIASEGGTYRLAGALGALAVPDSLHALLAARLDALDPPTRSLVAVASVLGSGFPAEALVAVSGREADEVRAGLEELVRRDVLEVFADPLSPQRGDFRFAQELLRQVAYETLSRRERHSRHLAVARHLRESFANDGEEIAEVIARHYLDALEAAPEDADAAATREQALSMLLRAAERAARAGAPARASDSFAAAARLADVAGREGDAEGSADWTARSASMWERAARSAVTASLLEAAVEHATTARARHLARGDERGAARAQAIAGSALRLGGRHREARAELAEALAVLRPEPDADTIVALSELVKIEIFGGGSQGDQLSAELLAMGQALDVDEALLARLFSDRGITHGSADRNAQAAAYFRESARLAERSGDNAELSRALLNLSTILGRVDAAGEVDAARSAADHARRVGDPAVLSIANSNLVMGLLEIGEWNECEAVLANEAGLDEHSSRHPYLIALRGLVAALRGDGAEAERHLALLGELTASEDVQDRANAAGLRAFSAAASGRLVEALAAARDVLGYITTLGVGDEFIRWNWPLAARLARALGDDDATADLVALLDAHPRGHLPPLLRAERELARAFAAVAAGDGDAPRAFAAAVAALRAAGSLYHLAHGLLDLASAWLAAPAPDLTAFEAAVSEAVRIGERLRCPPLLERAGTLARRDGTRRDGPLSVRTPAGATKIG